VFGQKLRNQVEDRLKFYETGDIPAKNVDVMKEALAEAKALMVSLFLFFSGKGFYRMFCFTGHQEED
jgi:hypothetical protein